MTLQGDFDQYLIQEWVHCQRSQDQGSLILGVVWDFCHELRGLSGDLQYSKGIQMPKSFHKPYQTLCQNGYVNLALQKPYGPQLSWVLHHRVWEILAGAEISLTTCPMLSFGVLNTLIQYENPVLKPYIEDLVSNRATGTMCLTEAQSGSDLRLIQTLAKASPAGYHITGHKIWVTYGDHDLTEQILHLVLAKTDPEGKAGLSLFLVPKLLEGKPNGVYCQGMVETMGQAQTPTCMIDFEDAYGILVGKIGQGMEAIFTLMNPARIGVGVQALGLSEAAYQKAKGFAKIRRSVRMGDHRVSIDQIPDVQRMLDNIELSQYAMRLLVAYTGYHLDQGNLDIARLLTPMVKAYLSERSVENISDAMQIMGGFGYLKVGQCEKYYRDARVTMIYEGTNGIQAQDLLMRKVLKDQGRTLRKLLGHLGQDPMYQELNELHQSMQGVSREALSYIATDYLHYLSWMVMMRLIKRDRYWDGYKKSRYCDIAVSYQKMYQHRMEASISRLNKKRLDKI